jgi:hypothetical protein
MIPNGPQPSVSTQPTPPRRRRAWLWAIPVVVVLAVAAGFGIPAWKRMVVKRQDDLAFQRAQAALQTGRPADALALFQVRSGESPHPWPDIELDALAKLRQVNRLMTIHERDPRRIFRNETASLLVAQLFMHTRKSSELKTLREGWLGREQIPVGWFTLDVDALLLAGKPKEARKLLESRTFPGTNDVPRLVRLSLLEAGNRNLTNAWNRLAEANALDARNSEVRSYRAQLLETIGQTPLARVEYVAAHVADPSNPLWRDQLAEFYRRQGSLDLALTTWRDAAAATPLDFLVLKSATWGRLVQPGSVSNLTALPLSGTLGPLAEYVRDLPPGTFWDATQWTNLAAGRKFAAERPEVFWLELLGRLKSKDEAGALTHLRDRGSRAGDWSPELHRALGRLLSWRSRTNGTFLPPSLQLPVLNLAETNLHQAFVQVERLAQAEREGRGAYRSPPAEAKWWRSDQALAALVIASGWREAGLTLVDPASLAADAPEWATYGFAQALRYNRGIPAARAFLKGREAGGSALRLLAGELALAEGDSAVANANLGEVAREATDAGFRAAWLLAAHLLDQKKYAEVRREVAAHPRLATSVTGTELLARAALGEGKTEEATRLYTSVASGSGEARAYLARVAFNRKDWPTARRYTEELLRLYPDELELRANLDLIRKSESATNQ